MKSGLFIDANRRITFNFDGRDISAQNGDTVATALWRNGIKTVSRSFKYHRRRGILSLSGADANVLVDIDNAPNVLADSIRAADGMVVRARHCEGSVEKDYLAFMNWLSPFLPSGFYYKAFYKPRGAWRKWEPLIRRLAGLGVVNPSIDSPLVDKLYQSCDIAIIGAGPAGLAAARAAAQQGKRVYLLDKNPLIGGTLNWRGGVYEHIADIATTPNIKILTDCHVTSIFDNLIVAQCPSYSLRLRAERIIYATGARDTPIVFANNDLPGIMLVSAALRLAALYDLACGRRAVIIAANSADADAARLLRDYGVSIEAIFNIGDADSPWMQSLTNEGFIVYHNISKFAARGRFCVEAAQATTDARFISVNCDCLLMNGGSIPTCELPASSGIAYPYVASLERPAIEHNDLAGALHNRRALSDAIADGDAAGKNDNTKRPPFDVVANTTNVFFPNEKGKAFIDFDEDLQIKDLNDAIDEGFDDIQLLKRYTTAGMGPAQGKLTNVLIMRYLAKRLQADTATIGQVTARPPSSSETLAQLAHEPAPIKRSALHHIHDNLSATWIPAGHWRRPAYYSDASKESEVVRNNAGIIDISTLGKIQVSGHDAAAFLERLYTGKFTQQKIGAVRYALMLDEAGIITDDGIVARLGDDDNSRFWVTTTTGNADAIYRAMLLWLARWKMKVDVINMTSAFAAINLAGPNAMALLAKLTDNPLSLGYMQAAEINLCDINAIIMRVGFVGEKGYEIHLPYGYAVQLWNILIKDAEPFGVETQRLLRLEKGHIIVGQDTDGLTTPLEANMEWALGKNKEFYLGQRALSIHRKRGIQRQLRGFMMDANRRRIDESDLTLDEKGNAVGRVTSVAYSPALRCIVGLAYAPVNTPKENGVIKIRAASGEIMEAITAPPPFYDPQGERQQ